MPHDEYQTRLDDRKASLAALERRDVAISNWRLIVFLSGVCLGAGVLLVDWLNPAWLLSLVLPYLALVVFHDRIIRAKHRAEQAVRYYEYLLSRLDGTWPGSGILRADFVTEDHPYAADLDLFGKGSLFELLCTARTRGGENTLARWLCQPAAVEEIRARQQAVANLRPLIDLREDLALLGGGLRATVDPETLVRWGSAPAVFNGNRSTLVHAVSWTLTGAALITLALWIFTSVGPLPLLGVLLGQWGAYRWLSSRVKQVVKALDQPERELMILAGVLKRIETEDVQARRLTALKEMLGTNSRRFASTAIRHLARLTMWLDTQKNALFAPIGFMLMWSVHFSLAIESWRLKNGRHIERWLEAISEFEALSALAAYAFEHPDDPFPDLVTDGPLFDGQDLGHPLLPETQCVRNSVRLGEQARAWIVSGSNMSGKSTLLRTVGVNALLAQAGAPVRATRLRLCLLNIGATIRIHDSLQSGRSRFYVEITRLKQLMDLTGADAPLLFLLDEILHGTNSHDRRIGATAFLRGLVDAGAIGLVTTHDLALADVSDGSIENWHFDDSLEEGQLVFDYLVKPGVVQGSNAVALMREVGLPV